ncbi:MAG: hypothetical protein ACRD8O_15785 [Bryobacteraceae bacterium]
MSSQPSASTSPQMIVLGESDWQFAHPEAQILMGINVKAVLESPVIQAIIMGTQKQGIKTEEIESVRSMLSDVDRIAISVQSSGGGKPEALVYLTGRLQDPRLRASFTKGGSGVRFLDTGGVLLGDEPSLITATRRMSDPAAGAANPLFELARTLSAQSDVWIASTGEVIPNVTRAMGAGAAPLPRIRNFSVGLGLRSGLQLDLTLNAATNEGAAQLFTLYRQMEAQMRKSAKSQSDWEQWSRSSQVERLPSGLRIRYAVDQTTLNQELAKASSTMSAQMRSLLSNAMIGMSMPGLPAPGAEPLPPPKPARNTVIIDGLDGGPKEIPVQRK